MKSTAKAYANIALMKYWGKRDEDLILPYNSSLSMTLNKYWAETTVEYSEKYKKNEVYINDEKFKKDEKDIHGFLDKIAALANVKLKARMHSETNVPIAAGLASSTCGFAALAVAATSALNLEMPLKELSKIARQGSGSATRSLFGGFVEWTKGENKDGSDSYAVQVADENHWPEMRIIACVVNPGKKRVSSRAGMSKTVETCPLYDCWLESADSNLETIREGILEKDFTKTGETSEHNALKLHATMMTTIPSIIYWIPSTVEVIQEVLRMRKDGIEAYFTMDAGPNVKILCLEENEGKILERVQTLEGVIETTSSKPGKGPEILNEHLF